MIMEYGGSSSEKEPLHSFRMTCHPAAALENSRLDKQSSCRRPTYGNSTDVAAQQLACLTLREISSNQMRHHESHMTFREYPSHYFAADNSQSPQSISSPMVLPPDHVVAPCEERWSSPSSSPATVQSCASSSENPVVTKEHRARFLVFIKILFKSLDNTNEHELRDRAKRIVAECTRRNRLGDPLFSPLVEAVERRLRRVVGEAHWRKASLLLRHFSAKQNGKAGYSIA